jgi:hypothetical protein
MTLSITFRNRDFTYRTQPALDMVVQRYSHSAIGGPRTATIAAVGGEQELWNLLNMIRCPVEIDGEYTEALWWGYIDRIDVTVGNYTIAADIADMANELKILYGNNQETIYVGKTDSEVEYGIKQLILTVDNMSTTWALQYQQNYLSSHQYPLVDVQPNYGGNNSATISCRGWWSTLDWRYPSVASGSAVDTAKQIGDIILQYGDFLQGYSIEGTSRTTPIRPDSGLTVNPYRDGLTTAYAIIETLCETGTTDYFRLLPSVNPDRSVVIRKETAYTTTSNVYQLMTNGDLLSPYGEFTPPELCKVGEWCSIADIIPASVDVSRLSDLPYFFIEESEYNALTGKTQYIPRNMVNLWQMTQVKNG